MKGQRISRPMMHERSSVAKGHSDRMHKVRKTSLKTKLNGLFRASWAEGITSSNGLPEA